VAYSEGGRQQLRVLIESGPFFVLEVQDDSGTFHRASGVSATAGWNKVVIDWEAAASASPSIAVNDGTPAELTGLDTEDGRVDFVRWGAIGGALGTTSGTIALDDFQSWR
jgi:hypothetical protein